VKHENTKLQVSFTQPQIDFYALKGRYPAFVTGFGGGKTECMANIAVLDSFAGGASSLVALYEPTYDLVKLIIAPRMQELLDEGGFAYTYNKSDHIIFTSSGQLGDFIFRTMDNPARIVGYQAFRSHVDELDTLPQDKAEEAWKKILGRTRQNIEGQQNTTRVYTTPEGFRFVYNRWQKSPDPDYQLKQASSRSNPFLPKDYLDKLEETYGPELAKAYIDGQFVNMTTGSVYHEFDRERCQTKYTVAPREQLHIGMDFNVYNMTAAVSVIRKDTMYLVDEFHGLKDTPDLIDAIREKYPNHKIFVYPDASGRSRNTTNSTVSDHRLLREAGFVVKVRPSNPSVRDRIASVNNAFLRERVRINSSLVPFGTECLEQQAYNKSGDPDKTTGLDHFNDAVGYLVHWHFAIQKPQVSLRNVRTI
jgi:hypothetical protein